MSFFKQLFCRHEAKLIHICDVYGDRIFTMPRYTRSVWQCPKCGKYLYKEYLGKNLIYIPDTDMGNVSDGHHTFNELYDHRARLFAVVCHTHKALAWKSKVHDDGTMYDGMFICGIHTPMGPATYHYDIDPYWDLFDIKELDKAPKWDGHTPTDAINRIYCLTWGTIKEEETPVRVAYTCDRKFCEECSPECNHCFDIRHAKNFECIADNEYFEKEETE